MCPDPQVLSIYLDGELPSPWKEKMEAHLAACPKCKEKLADYKRMHDIFIRGVKPSVRNHIPEEQKRIIIERDGSGNNPIDASAFETELLEKSKEKVWQKLAARQRYSSTGLVRRSGNAHGFSVWKRRLSIPLPIAVAAALLIIFGIAFVIQNRNSVNYLNNSFANIQTEYPSFIEEMHSDYLPANVANDINSVIQYLDANGADIIILQLPESKNFSRSGEPAIIRAADYSRVENARKQRRQP